MLTGGGISTSIAVYGAGATSPQGLLMRVNDWGAEQPLPQPGPPTGGSRWLRARHYAPKLSESLEWVWRRAVGPEEGRSSRGIIFVDLPSDETFTGSDLAEQIVNDYTDRLYRGG